MSLSSKIPGLARHQAPAEVVAPAPVAGVAAASVSPVPWHRALTSRTGIDYILAEREGHVARLQEEFPGVPVVGPDDLDALRGFGQAEADLAILTLSVFPGARVQSVRRLGASMSAEARERYLSRRRT